MNITLRQLRYVDSLARHGHFGRAAGDCAVTQPALSMQIRDLEAVLGAPLFERGSRQVRLTTYGQVFVDRARGILQAVGDLADLARAEGHGLRGRLRAGVIPTVAPYLLPTLIARLSAAHPDLDLHLRESVTPNLLQELRGGALDTAIIALPASEPALTEVALFSESFVLVRHADEAGRPVPNRNDLRTMRLLLLEEGHCFRDQALSFCDLPASRPREWLDGSSLSTLVQMVGAGIGVTLIPEMAVPVEMRSAPVCVAHFAAPRPSRTIGMVWRRSSPMSRHYAALAEIVRLAAEDMQAAALAGTGAT